MEPERMFRSKPIGGSCLAAASKPGTDALKSDAVRLDAVQSSYAGVPEPASELAQAFRAAVERHVTGDLDGATAAYRDILSIVPTHCGALHLLGVVSGQRGDHWTALDLIQQSLRHDPHMPKAY